MQKGGTDPNYTTASLNTHFSIFLPRNPVKPGKQASVTIRLLSEKKGTRYVEASFQCDQIKSIRGEFEVKIK